MAYEVGRGAPRRDPQAGRGADQEEGEGGEVELEEEGDGGEEGKGLEVPGLRRVNRTLVP